MKIATPRNSRSALNKAWSGLGSAQARWGEFILALEQLAELHEVTGMVASARDVGSQMHAFREVLQAWSKD